MNSTQIIGTLERTISWCYEELNDEEPTNPKFNSHYTYLVTRKQCAEHDNEPDAKKRKVEFEHLAYFFNRLEGSEFVVVDHVDNDNILVTWNSEQKKKNSPVINQGCRPCISSVAERTKPPVGAEWYHAWLDQDAILICKNADTLRSLLPNLQVYLVCNVFPLQMLYIQSYDEAREMEK